MFDKVLIANRGEIACRVIRTAKRMGVRTVAVFSDADQDALHVRCADEALRIGPGPASESYLSIDRLLDAARRSGAEAIHPGYGFLSESPEFSSRCSKAGLIFIGPSAESMRKVGSKSGAKKLATHIGAPTLPGFHGDDQDERTFADAAERIGFPVVIKASAGGGGRGMRVVSNASELASAMESARREALAAFGDSRLLVEKYLDRPRHVEVQFVADRFGDVVTFWERDCSLQRNHQKLVEESPAPGLAPELRRALRETAPEIARAADYVGAGTVEFLVKDQAFYFLEVNARLQVEHPVTEMISSIDLVEWQFRIAAGERLPLTQDEIVMRGCAIEARICAEDPAANFRPSSGLIVHLAFPPESPRLRMETGIGAGDRVPPYYDSLIAKLVVWADDRDDAVRRMRQALDEVELVGVVANLDFLREIVSQPPFLSGEVDTRLVETVARTRPPPDNTTELWLLAAAVAAWREDAARRAWAIAAERGESRSPWAVADAWRLAGAYEKKLDFRLEGKVLTCLFRPLDKRTFLMDDESREAEVIACFDREKLSLCVDGVRRRLSVVRRESQYVIIIDGHNFTLEWVDPLAPPAPAIDKEKSFLAPLPARVTRIFVKDGERVEKGAPILVLEAMKMEIPMNAPGGGIIESILCSEGQSVQEGDKLVAMAEGA